MGIVSQSHCMLGHLKRIVVVRFICRPRRKKLEASINEGIHLSTLGSAVPIYQMTPKGWLGSVPFILAL